MEQEAELASVISFATADLIVQQVRNNLSSKLDAYFVTLANTLIEGFNDKAKFKAANEIIASDMKEAVLAAYDERFSEHKVYRVNTKRLSGGKLRRALDSDSMFGATSKRIWMGDTELLDREARHWMRLNYGTLDAEPLYDRVEVPVILANTTLTTLSDNTARRAPFKMPIGIWKDGEFWPTSRSAWREEDSNIAGRRFFDAGLTAFAESFPAVYEDLFRQIVAEAGKEARTSAKQRRPKKAQTKGKLQKSPWKKRKG